VSLANRSLAFSCSSTLQSCNQEYPFFPPSLLKLAIEKHQKSVQKRKCGSIAN
jgi:hypothetical protein